MLFYVGALSVLVLGLDSSTYAILGYLYIAMRLLHGWFHLGQNKLIPRARAFGASHLILVIIWLMILWESAFMGPVTLPV